MAKARIIKCGASTKQGNSHTSLPKSWPPNIVYLTAPLLSPLLKPEQLTRLQCLEAESVRNINVETTSYPCSLVQITSITDPKHPAFGQHGLHASQHLPPDTFILSYLGFVHGNEDSDETSDYDISLDRELDVAVDASSMGNEARFINDYRGVRPEGANAEFRDCWISNGNGLLEKRIGVYVLTAGKSGKRAKGIAKDAEILVSYGKGFWSNRLATSDHEVSY